MNSLEIVPEFPNYSELLQRVVVLFLMHTTSDDLTLDGRYTSDIVSTVVTGSALDFVEQQLNIIGSTIKRLINSESETDDRLIDRIDVKLNTQGAHVRFVVTITTSSGTETGELTING